MSVHLLVAFAINFPISDLIYVGIAIMVVVCLGPVCIPAWPLVALALKPICDKFIPASVKAHLTRIWVRINQMLCSRRKTTITSKGGSKSTGRIRRIRSEAEYDTISSASHCSPVLIKFTADFCGPCKQISPRFIELAGRYSSISFYEIDIEELDELALKLGVCSIPAFHGLRGGRKVDEVVGANLQKVIEICDRYGSTK